MSYAVNKDCRVVMVGKTGVGKSSVGNSMLMMTKEKAFKNSVSGESVTERCKLQQAFIASKGLLLTVIDTPGLFDTKQPNEKTTAEIIKCIGLSAPGPHVFLFIISVHRFTEEEMNTFRILKSTFGDDVKKYTIVVLTGADQFDDTDDDDITSVDDYVKSSPQYLRDFIRECGGRYVGICNRPKNTNHKRDVDLLQDKIIKTVDANGNSHYSQEMFKKAEKVIQDEIEQRKKKTPQKGEDEIRKEVKKELETKTEDSEKSGFWGNLGSALSGSLNSVLSIPKTILGWFS